MKRTVILVDYAWLYHRSVFAMKFLRVKIGEKDILTGGMFGILRDIGMLQEKYKAKIIFCLEPKKNFRKKIATTYKEGRVKDDSIYDLMNETKEALRLIPGVELVTADDGEGDDVIASWIWDNEDNYDKFFVFFKDNDLLQIPCRKKLRDKVYLASTSKDKVDRTMYDYCIERMGVVPKKLTMLKSITGDSSDNVPKLVKRMKFNLIKEIANDFDRPEDFISFVEEKGLERFKGREVWIERLLENKEQWFINYNLVQLKHVKVYSYSCLAPLTVEYFRGRYQMRTLSTVIDKARRYNLGEDVK